MIPKISIENIARSCGFSENAVRAVIRGLANEVERNLRNGQPVAIPDFVSFKFRDDEPRTARDPRNGREVRVGHKRRASASLAAKFRQSVQPEVFITKNASSGPKVSARVPFAGVLPASSGIAAPLQMPASSSPPETLASMATPLIAESEPVAPAESEFQPAISQISESDLSDMPAEAELSPPEASVPEPEAIAAAEDGEVWKCSTDGGSVVELKAGEMRGIVTADTLVWREGFSQWVEAGQLPELRQHI